MSPKAGYFAREERSLICRILGIENWVEADGSDPKPESIGERILALNRSYLPEKRRMVMEARYDAEFMIEHGAPRGFKELGEQFSLKESTAKTHLLNGLRLMARKAESARVGPAGHPSGGKCPACNGTGFHGPRPTIWDAADLRACPGCSTKVLMRTDTTRRVVVECRSCGMRGPEGRVWASAVKRWNDLPR